MAGLGIHAVWSQASLRTWASDACLLGATVILAEFFARALHFEVSRSVGKG